MEKFTFFNDVDNDRIYFAEDFARHLATYFTNGIFNNGCLVLADNDNMSVNVSVGSANINGYRYDNDSIKTLSIENADGVLNRIDNIVIRWDLTNRTITTQVIKGSFAETPVAPALVRTSTIYDLRIAKVSVPAGTTTITQDLVTDTRFITSDCGDVISTVETPDTEQLFIQLNAVFYNNMDNLESDFNYWFDNIRGTLSGDVAYNLNQKIESITPTSQVITLLSTNWVQNQTTELYEYTVQDENVTSAHHIDCTMDMINKAKISDGEVETFNGYYVFRTTELPTENVTVSVKLQLTDVQVQGGS